MIAQAARTRLASAASGDELRTLLAPVTPAAFVADYWAVKPLYVPGFKDKYAGFFDAEDFSRALSAPGPVPDDFLRASFDQKTERGTSARPATPHAPQSSVFRASPEQAVPLFDAGATLCISQIEMRVPRLRPFVAAIKRQLGWPGKVSFNAYLSPPGSGFNWHFDSRIASTLQIEGTKRWRFSQHPAIAWPRGNGTMQADGKARYSDPTIVPGAWEQLRGFDEHDVTEVLLEPGDLLIIPAGVWHEACGGASGSLALNLSFTAVSYTQLVQKLLDTLLTGEAGWRGPAPVLPGSNPGDVDPAGLAAIGEQLARAATALGSLSADSAAVVRLWESFVHTPSPATALPLPSSRAVEPIGPTQRLRVRAGAELCAMLADGGSRLCLVMASGRSLELTGPAVPFVQRILREGEFAVSDCQRWNVDGEPFAYANVVALLTELRREGLVDVVPANAPSRAQ